MLRPTIRLRGHAALAALALASSAAAHAQIPRPVGRAELAARVDSLGSAFVAARLAPSVSIAVVRGRDSVALRAFGMADATANVPATPATVYQIGSITKQFTAAAVMQLVEQRKVSLDSGIGAYLPDLPQAWRGVTVRHLLNHTSGIPSYTGSAKWRPRMAEDMTPDAILAFVAADTMDFPVGARYRYNNSGYVLLGMLLEKQTGQPYSKYVQSRFFGPLGLRSSSYCENAPKDPRVARGFERGATYTATMPISMTQPHAAGALCATAADIARWNTLLATGRVVRPESYTAMTTPVGAAVNNKYGFGLTSDTLAGRRIIRHGGNINGFQSANVYVPSDSLSITVLANASGNDVDRVAMTLLRAAYGLPPAAPQPQAQAPQTAAVALSAAERARYVGSYAITMPNGSTRTMRIFEQDGRLMGEPEGQGASALVPQGNHVFAPAVDPVIRLVFTVDGDRATKLAIQQGGRTFEGPRAP